MSADLPTPAPEGKFATFVVDPPWRYGSNYTATVSARFQGEWTWRDGGHVLAVEVLGDRDRCPAVHTMAAVLCTRAVGHSGRHAARVFEKVLAVWR